MTHILAISSSPNPATSKTKAMIDQFIGEWSTSDASVQVTHRDLASRLPEHLDSQTIGAFYTPVDDLSADQKDLLSHSDEIIEELLAADIILIGAPMFNFGIPSSLKAWIDQMARVGKTFTYTDNGPVGLLKNKRVIVLGARGGNYSKSSPVHAMDHQTPYLKTVLGFVGLSDVSFIYAEGVAANEEGVVAAEKAIHDHVTGMTTQQVA